MSEQPYRKEAVEARRETVWGSTVLVQPVHHMWLTGLTALSILSFIVFLMIGSYARSETVNGALVPEAGFVRVMAPRRGIITKVHVTEDQAVSSGDPLVTVDVETIAGDGTAVGTGRVTALEVKRDALRRLLEGIDAKYEAQEAVLLVEQTGVTSRLEAVRSRLESSRKLVELARAQVGETRALHARKALSEAQLRTDEQSLLELAREVEAGRAQEGELDARLGRLTLELADLPRRIDSEKAELEASLADVVGEISLAKGQRSYTLVAEVPGRVAALQAVPGHVADFDVPLMTLLPLETGLIAELYVPTRAVGFMRPGQNVRLRYDAFPHRRFGVYSGTVTQVSSTILLPGELPMALGLEEPAYRIVVRPERQSVTAYGSEYRLKAGMLLQSEIILEERTLMRWLLDPLYSLQGRK